MKQNKAGEHILVCFQMDPEKIYQLIDSYLRDLLPNFYVSVVDFNNRLIYKESIGRDSKYFYEARFPTTLYKWLLQLVPRNYPEIERQAANQRRTYSFLIVLSITLIFCSLAIIHLASRRERQLTQMKEDFISHVSHELKTPLSLIRMYCEMLATNRVQGDKTREDYYEIIHSESNRLSHLVNNLLDFSRLDPDGKKAKFESTDLGRLVVKSLDAYRHQMEQEGFRIQADIEDGLPQLAADPNALTTAVINLLDNSLKYSGNPKEVRVRVFRQNGYLNLTVADRGIGIPASEQKKVFEKFYRGKEAQSKNIRGSGIGLAIIQQVAELHGGEVTVHSAPGEGSTFTLRLPVSGRAEP
jgi:two-component system phosphate regulon sensor histidine kinase PhoR